MIYLKEKFIIILVLLIGFVFIRCSNLSKVSENITYQNFEGEITYDVITYLKINGLSLEQVLNSKHIEHFTVKDEKYIRKIYSTYSEDFNTCYYLGDDNLYFDYNQELNKMMYGHNKLTYRPFEDFEKKITSMSLEKDSDVVLGKSCDVLVVNLNERKEWYYFNKDYPLNTNNPARHSWDFYSKKTKSLPLKKIIENDKLRIEMVAKDVVWKKIKKSQFKLPKYPLKKLEYQKPSKKVIWTKLPSGFSQFQHPNNGISYNELPIKGEKHFVVVGSSSSPKVKGDYSYAVIGISETVENGIIYLSRLKLSPTFFSIDKMKAPIKEKVKIKEQDGTITITIDLGKGIFQAELKEG